MLEQETLPTLASKYRSASIRGRHGLRQGAEEKESEDDGRDERCSSRMGGGVERRGRRSRQRRRRTYIPPAPGGGSGVVLFTTAPPSHPHLSPWALKPHKDSLSIHCISNLIYFSPRSMSEPGSLGCPALLWSLNILSTDFFSFEISQSPFLFLAVISLDSLKVLLEEYFGMLVPTQFFRFPEGSFISSSNFENIFLFITK